MNAALSRPTMAGLAVALGLVLVLSPALGSVASVLASVIALLLAPAGLSAEGWRKAVREPAIVLLLAAFAALAAVFAATANDFGDLGYILNFVALPLGAILYLLVQRFDDPRLGERLAWLCFLGAITAVLVALVGVFILGQYRAHGFAGGPNLLPRVAITLGFVALAGVFLTTGWVRLVFYLAPLAAIVTTYLSASRGAALAIPILIVLASLFLALDRSTRRHLLVIVSLAAVAAAFVLGFGGSALLGRFGEITNTIIELITTGQSSDFSTNERLVVLGAAWPAFLSSPWIGWGWGNLGQAINTVAPHLSPYLGDNVFFHADIANFAVAGGIVGILAWLAILLAPTIGALRGPRDARYAARLYIALALTLSYAVFGLTDFTLGFDLPTTLFAFLVAIVPGALRERPAD